MSVFYSTLVILVSAGLAFALSFTDMDHPIFFWALGLLSGILVIAINVEYKPGG